MSGHLEPSAPRPRLAPNHHAQVMPGHGVLLVSDRGRAMLTGSTYEVVVPELDGLRTEAEIAAALDGRVAPAKVYYALALLRKAGYLEDGPAATDGGLATFWADQGFDSTSAAGRLAETTVSVTTFGDLPQPPLHDALRSVGATVAGPGAGDLDVVVTDDYLRPELAAHNEDAVRHRRPWLLTRPVGNEVWVGPLFRPGRTACWECLAERLRNTREVELMVQDHLGLTGVFPVPRSDTDAVRNIAYGIAAVRVARWIVDGGDPLLEDGVLSFDPTTWEMGTHLLVRQPSCPACGDRDPVLDRLPEPLRLRSGPKVFVADGGHRTVTPAQTWDRFRHHVSHITGLLADLERADIPSDGAVNVYRASDNRSVRARSVESMRDVLGSQSSGKGVTDIQARVSGLCEALERYSGWFRGDEPRRTARLGELDGAIHPNDVMLFSDAQYRNRDPGRESRFNKVPLAFEPDREVEWSPLWSLTTQSVRYLPTGLCYARKATDLFYRADSNGSAAGNTVEEAIVQGFMELAERDAIGVWWYNRLARPGVDLDSFDDPYPGRLGSYLDGIGRDLLVLDLTNDLGVPVFGAFSRRLGSSPERIVMGFGAHLDARIGVLRALTELNQMLTWVLPVEIGSAAEDPVKDVDGSAWLADASLARDAYLAPRADGSPRTAADFPASSADDLRDDVLACQAIVEGLGLEMLVMDQTRPDVGLPVVKVVVPGLRHCHARLAPGRLYDVPVEQGWLDGPVAEHDLNPIPFFL